MKTEEIQAIENFIIEIDNTKDNNKKEDLHQQAGRIIIKPN